MDLMMLRDFLANRSKGRPFDFVSGRLAKRPPPNPKLRLLRPFAFEPSLLRNAALVGFQAIPQDPAVDLRMDLPFESIWIESFDEAFMNTWLAEPDERGRGETVMFQMFGLALAEYAIGYKVEAIGAFEHYDASQAESMRRLADVLVGEVEHGRPIGDDLRAAVRGTATRRYKSTLVGTIDDESLKASHAARQIYAFTQNLFELMRSKDTATGSQATRERLVLRKETGTRTSIEIAEIVHVTLRESREEYAAAAGLGEEIDWTHRWEVMGHWRRVRGIGKDRTGKYCVRGSTWVRPHTKGPADKPLVPKTRVVTGSAAAVSEEVHPFLRDVDFDEVEEP